MASSSGRRSSLTGPLSGLFSCAAAGRCERSPTVYRTGVSVTDVASPCKVIAREARHRLPTARQESDLETLEGGAYQATSTTEEGAPANLEQKARALWSSLGRRAGQRRHIFWLQLRRGNDLKLKLQL